jgi:CYTH domain-containing protein
MAMEIERKFLVARRPDLEGAKRAEIEQGYLALGDGEGDAEVRLRRKNDELYLTVKAGSGRTRLGATAHCPGGIVSNVQFDGLQI